MITNDDLTKSLEEVGLDLVVPNNEALREALTLDGSMLSSLTNQKISSMIFTLSRFQLYLQVHSNVRTLNHKKAKREFEKELNSTLIQLKCPKSYTVKEKVAQAFIENPNLTDMEEKVVNAEGHEILFHKTPESILEIINALKKELSTRGN